MTDYKRLEQLIQKLLIVVADNKEAVQKLKVEQIKLQRDFEQELEAMHKAFESQRDEWGRDPGNEL